MKIECLKNREMDVAVVSSDEKVIVDVQSALDLVMTVKYETGVSRIVLDKNLVCEDFFILSTGVAGEILQKFINYRVKAAIYGDYSRYTSKPLRDFIYESNNGHDFFFVSTNYVQYWGASACPSVAANRCNSTSSIFNSPTTPVDAGGVCNTFATVNRGLKINFQGANTPYPGRGINPPRGRFWESDSFLASGCPP